MHSLKKQKYYLHLTFLLILSACSTSSNIIQNYDKDNSFTYDSYPNSFDPTSNKSDSFCQSNKLGDKSQVLSVKRGYNSSGEDVIQRTFKCTTKEKIAEEEANERAKVQKDLEERKRFEEGRKAAEIQKQANIAKEEKLRKEREKESLTLLIPKAIEIANQRNRYLINNCKTKNIVSTEIKENLARKFSINPNSISLKSANYRLIDTAPNSYGIMGIAEALKDGFSKNEDYGTCTIVLYHPRGVTECTVRPGSNFRCEN
jgi:hypothetical protein